MKEAPKFHLALVLALAPVMQGCGTTEFSRPDGGLDGVEEAPPQGSLHFLEESETDLGPRESGLILGYYLDPGGAPARTTIAFSLLGNAFDATLETTSRETDERGNFTVVVTAGSVITSFELRAVASDGAKAELRIEIVERRSGVLLLAPFYEGRRRIDQYSILLFESGSCPSAEAEPDFVALKIPPEEFPFTFSHLPEGVSFAVSLLGELVGGDSGESECFAWVEGCREGVVVETFPEATTVVEVIDDRSYFAHEAFAVRTTLDAEEILGNLADRLTAPLFPLSGSHEEVAALILDGIQQGLGSEIERDIFSISREESALDRALAKLLVSSGGASLGEEVSDLVDFLYSSARKIHLSGRLERDFWPDDPGEEMIAMHVLESIDAGGQDVIEALQEGGAMESIVSVSYDGDVARLGIHEFPVGAGSLLLAVATHAYVPSLIIESNPGSNPIDEWLESRIDCGAVGALIAENSGLASLAGEENPAAWYEARCLELLAGITRDMDSARHEIDLQLDSIELSGSADFLDSDGAPREGKVAQGAWTGFRWGGESLSAPPEFTLVPSI